LLGIAIVMAVSCGPSGSSSSSDNMVGTSNEPFYGMAFVPLDELGLVKNLGAEVVLATFAHDGPAEDWLSYIDEAQAQGILIIAWLWPQGWNWDGTTWDIDDQAIIFVVTVADHPAIFAIYSLHEPYWNGCDTCGYTTAEQQSLYNAIKDIAEVPIWSDVGGMAFWTAKGEETAFADGMCDYCVSWYYPFKKDGIYERKKLIEQLTADLSVAKERAPNSKIWWYLQSFAQGTPYNLRMPVADEMRDLASIVFSTDIDGAIWYVWRFGELYNDYLSIHPELHPVVREIYEQYIF